jgi:hypothetical protein
MIEGFGPGGIENEFGDRAPIAPGNEESAEVDQDVREKARAADAGAAGGDAALDKGGMPSNGGGEAASLLDDVARFLAAPDPQTFFGGLIGALSSFATKARSADRGTETMLRLLGWALGDAIDEELAFQEVVDALDRRHRRSADCVAVSAVLLARIVAGSSLRTRSAPTSAEAAGLVRAAAQVVQEALDSGKAQSRRLLPHIASTIARRNAQRNLPIGTLAAALPRLWSQWGPGPHDILTAAEDQPRSGPVAEPQLMVLNGPVEILILGR